MKLAVKMKPTWYINVWPHHLFFSYMLGVTLFYHMDALLHEMLNSILNCLQLVLYLGCPDVAFFPIEW